MTTTLSAQNTPPVAESGGSGGFTRLLRSEWTKLRTVRSTVWSLVLLVVLTLGFTGLFIALTVSQWDKSTHSQQQQIINDPVGMILGGGFQLSQLAICVLGVMVMASEYSTGIALSVGAIVRHVAGAITGIIGFVLVLAPLAQLLPGSLGDHIHAYLPTEAGRLIAQSRQGPNDLLTPWQGFGVFAIWTAALLAVAAYLLNRRDA
jgi:ABC-2 type transport system permease protein